MGGPFGATDPESGDVVRPRCVSHVTQSLGRRTNTGMWYPLQDSNL